MVIVILSNYSLFHICFSWSVQKFSAGCTVRAGGSKREEGKKLSL